MNKRLEMLAPNEDLILTKSKIPDAPPNGAVVKLHYAGICHSDVHFWENKMDLGSGNSIKPCNNPAFKIPCVLGHEMSGEIFSIGKDVTKAGFNVGKLVMVYPWNGCGECVPCKRLQQTLCPKSGAFTMGLCLEGGFQNYVSVSNVDYLLPVPDGLPMDVACLMPCSGVTAYHAVKDVQDVVKSYYDSYGEASLLIVGAGGLGLWGIQTAKHLMPKGTKIIVAEASEEKFEFALAAGATDTLLLNAEEAPEQITEKIKQLVLSGVNAAVDFVGSAVTSNVAFGALGLGGTLVVIGLYGGQMALSLPLLPTRVATVKGLKYGDPCHVQEVAELAAQGKINAPTLTHVKLEEAQSVLEDLKHGRRKGRAIIKYN